MAPKYSSRTLEWLNVSNWAAVYEPCSFSLVLVQHLPDFVWDLNRLLRDLVWQSRVGQKEGQENSDGDKNAAAPLKHMSCFILEVFSVPGHFYEDFECSWSCRNASSCLNGIVYRWRLPGLCLSSSGSTPPRTGFCCHGNLITPGSRLSILLPLHAGVTGFSSCLLDSVTWASTLHLHPRSCFPGRDDGSNPARDRCFATT